MEFTKKASFTKQIALYLKNGNYDAALPLAKQFLEKFPEEMVAHFLLAKAAFWKKEYELSLKESLQALRMCGVEDSSPAAVLAASSHYMLGRYAEGHKFLSQMTEPKTEELERMKIIFAAVVGDEAGAERHAEELFKINKKAAEELLIKLLST